MVILFGILQNDFTNNRRDPSALSAGAHSKRYRRSDNRSQHVYIFETNVSRVDEEYLGVRPRTCFLNMAVVSVDVPRITAVQLERYGFEKTVPQ